MSVKGFYTRFMDNEKSSETDVRQNLTDAECPKEMIACFIALQAKENLPEQLAFLDMHRKTLLNRVHQSQYSLDCLDFLIFALQKQSGTKTPKQRNKEHSS